MANRRMFSKSIAGSSKFISMMPHKIQALYFQLGMNTDDDGFVEYIPVMLAMGLGQPDVNHLATGGYLLVYQDGIAKITHHTINNRIRKDRYTESVYKGKRLQQLKIDGKPNGNQTATTWHPSVVKVSIGKVSKEKEIKEKEKTMSDSKKIPSDATPHIEIINFLNEICSTKYKHTTPKTQALIKTRIKEGFTIGDFKTVIKKKATEWQNTNMSQYLRPETLFGNKFEGYLNEQTPVSGSGGECKNNSTLGARDHQTGPPTKKLKFSELEYPIGISSLTFESPVMIKTYLTTLPEPQKLELIGRIKKLHRQCDCGQSFITEADRKTCLRCDQTSPEDKKKLEAHRKRMQRLKQEDEEGYKELTTEQRRKNIQQVREITKSMGMVRR